MSFFDLLQNLFPESWFDSIRSGFGESLSNEDIAQSVHEASTFFNMPDPAVIQEDWTTGVYTNNGETVTDDLLVFNRHQLDEMGITEKQGFDLVMTHECAHRALQGMDELGFDSHQEELCCDFMAGVRAGLNGMDASIMQASLADTVESDTHPAGHERVQAISMGVEFAQDYMNDHNGEPPSFIDCLDHFSSIDDFEEEHSGQVVLRPDITFKGNYHGIQDIEWLKKQVRISSGSEQQHWLEELDWAQKHI